MQIQELSTSPEFCCLLPIPTFFTRLPDPPFSKNVVPRVEMYCCYLCFNLKGSQISKISKMALVGLGSFWVRLKRDYPQGKAIVIPAEKKIDIFLQYFLSLSLLAFRAVYIFAWKLVGGEMQLAIVYFVTILL